MPVEEDLVRDSDPGLPPVNEVRWMKVVVTVASIAGAVAYPFVVYAVLDRFGPHALGWVLLAALVPPVVVRVLGRGGPTTRPPVIVALLFVLAVLALALRQAGWVLMAPVVINIGLALSFGATLFSERPMIERFARLQHPDLSAAEVSWCRAWTIAWLVYFLVNVVVVSLLAAMAPVGWWTVYTGGIAYALMGLLFATEFVARKLRFGDRG